jgi:hypothetical protein
MLPRVSKVHPPLTQVPEPGRTSSGSPSNEYQRQPRNGHGEHVIEIKCGSVANSPWSAFTRIRRAPERRSTSPGQWTLMPGPVKTAELYYAIARKCSKMGETMKRAIIAGIVTAVVALAGAGATAVMAQVVPQVQPIQPGVTGAWTNFTLHLPGKKHNATIDASGALLSGAGTFVPTQIPGSGEPVLDVDILGCTFTVVVSGAQDNNHGSYLLFAGDEPANACAGLNGSGDWRINSAGTIVTGQGPVTIFRPKPAPSETITPPPSTTTQPPALGRTRRT